MSVAPPSGPTSADPIADRVGSVGTAGYWIGGILMVVGASIAVVLVILGLVRTVESLEFPRVVDRVGAVRIDDPGDQVIFAIGDGVSFTRIPVPPEVRVTDPTGSAVATAPYSGTRTATAVAGGRIREAVAIATFRAQGPGTYRLSASNLAEGVILGVGGGVQVRVGVIVFGGLGGGLILLCGLVLVVVTALRRQRRRPSPPSGPHPVSPPGRPRRPRGRDVAGFRFTR